MARNPIDVPVQLAMTGERVTLRDLLGGQAALVILTRHMDCPYCEVYVGRVMAEHGDLGRVIVVGYGSPEELVQHHSALPHEFVLVADGERSLYDAFRTRRLRHWSRMRIKLRNAPTLLRHFASGGRLVRPGQDLLQLGGDAIIDPDGSTRWVHLSQRVDDRPTMGELRSHLHRAA